MSLDDINKMFEKSMVWSNALAKQNKMHAMIEKSMGMSNMISKHNNMHAMVEKSTGPFQKLSEITTITNKLSQHNFVWGVNSTDWLAKNKVLQQMALPNNVFNLNKSLSQGLVEALSRNVGQQNTTMALTRGISSIVENSGFSKLLTTQHSILNKLTNLKQIGFKENQFRNVFNTLGSLSASMAIKGFSSFATATFPHLEKVASEAEGIANSVIQRQYVAASDLDDIHRLIDNINIKIDSNTGSEFKTFSFWLTLIGLFFAIYSLIQQKIDALDPNVAPATEQQIIDLRSKLIFAYHNNINLYSPIRITNRRCRIFLKPRLKSQQVMVVGSNEKLSIINSCGKWAMVTCLDKDSLPVTGWVLKKYLAKGSSMKK